MHKCITFCTCTWCYFPSISVHSILLKIFNYDVNKSFIFTITLKVIEVVYYNLAKEKSYFFFLVDVYIIRRIINLQSRLTTHTKVMIKSWKDSDLNQLIKEKKNPFPQENLHSVCPNIVNVFSHLNTLS